MTLMLKLGEETGVCVQPIYISSTDPASTIVRWLELREIRVRVARRGQWRYFENAVILREPNPNAFRIFMRSYKRVSVTGP